jgi:UDP-glucose 6-dehydrogenase
MLLKTFPFAPFTEVCTSTEAELIKYSRNVHGVFEILFYNMLYDLAGKLGADYENIKEYIKNDPLHVYRYASPVHASGHDLQNPKRGAGGHCFIKDFKAFKDFLSYNLKDEKYVNMLSAIEAKNIELLRNSEKDLDLLEGVYGKSNENKN